VDAAFSQGWRRVKLYFLIGLPTERDEDVIGIAELGKHLASRSGAGIRSPVTVTASVGGFVPKPHTPFQWFGQDTVEELQRKSTCCASRPGRPGAHHPLARAGRLGGRGCGQPGGPPHGGGHRAGVAGRGHLPGVVRAGSDLGLWEEALAAEGFEPGRGGLPATGDEHEPLARGITISAGLHRDFCGPTGRTPWAEAVGRRLPLDAVLRCGAEPASGSSTWWPRPIPPAGGARDGPGPGLRRADPGAACSAGCAPARCPCRDRPERWRRWSRAGSASGSPRRERSASPAIGTWPRMWERALRRSRLPVGLSQGSRPTRRS